MWVKIIFFQFNPPPPPPLNVGGVEQTSEMEQTDLCQIICVDPEYKIKTPPLSVGVTDINAWIPLHLS